MRLLALVLPLAFFGACATGPRIVATGSDTVHTIASVADSVVRADVVALGELHQTPDVHRTHHELIAAIHERRPNMVIAMEMFERDVSIVLLKYLNGLIDEGEFRAAARPWPNYARDYRPVIEFAKKNGIVVLAANAPRPLAQKAAKEGISAVMGDVNLARETTAPQDDYWEAFCEMMDGHGGMLGPGGMERYYAAQCLKDDTMAESITDYLTKQRKKGDRPLAILICGRAHSDHGRGTVARIKSRMPGLDVRVLSAETVDDLEAGLYESPRDVGDFVIVARTPVRKPSAMPKPQPEPKADVAKKPDGDKADEGPTENPEGMRPALGFMPNYSGEDVAGVGVGEVREGGPADKAGIEEGDVIVAIKGIPTPDIEMYMEVLNEQIIGRKITVRVRKADAEGDATVDLQVEVGSRPGR